MKKLKLTNEQKTIIKKALKGDSFFVEAFAGSAKTSTLFLYFRYAQQRLPNKKHLLLSFNTHLQKEYIEKIKEYSLDNISVMTINKLAKTYTLDRGIVMVDTVKVSTSSIRSIEPFIHGNDLIKYNTTLKKMSGWKLSVHLRDFCTSDKPWDNLAFTLFCNILRDGRCTHDMYMKLFREAVKNKTIKLNYDTVTLDECVVKNTMVELASGKAITIESLVDKLKRGSKIMVNSFNRETNTFEPKEAINPLVSRNRDIIEIQGNSFTIRCTPNHKVLTIKGYIRADKLKQYDLIAKSNPEGQDLPISYGVVHNVVKAGNETVYDFEVKDNHNFLIGESTSKVIVHNCQDTSETLFSIFRDIPIKQKIATGDIKQSIYMFLLKEFNMSNTTYYKDSEKLPLSKSFRCDNAITDKITNWLFRGFMDDPTSVYKGVINPDTSDTSIMHLTPTNNQVLLKAYSLARIGIKYRFQETWTNLTRDLKDIDFVLKNLSSYVGKTTKRSIKAVSSDIVKRAKSRNITMYGRDIQDYLIEDLLSFNKEYSDIPFTKFIEKYSTSNRTKTGATLVSMLSRKSLYLDKFLKVIKENTDKDSQITISNTHKVKGEECGTVNLFKFKSPEILAEETAGKLAEELDIPTPALFKDCIKLIEANKLNKHALTYRQNINLFYVAITRAKHTIIFDDCEGINNMRWDRITKDNPTGKVIQEYNS